MIKKLLIGLIVAVCVFAIGYNAWKSEHQNTNGKRRVYAILPLTGVIAKEGQDIKATMDIWMKLHPETKIDLVYVDSESQPMKAVTAFQQATLGDTNPLVISSVTPVTAALVPVVAKSKGFTVGMLVADGTKLEQNGQFQIIAPGITSEKNVLFPYILDNFDDFSIMYSNEELGRSSMTEFKKAALAAHKNILDIEAIDLRNLDTRIEVLKVMEKNPKAIIIFSQPTVSYMNIFKNLKNYGYKGRIITGGQFSSKNVFDNLNEYTSGVVFSASPLEYDTHNQDKEKYMEMISQHKGNLYPMYIFTYDILTVMDYILKNNLPFTQETFQQIGKLDGFSGDITFQGNGLCIYPYQLSQYNADGKIIPLKK